MMVFWRTVATSLAAEEEGVNSLLVSNDSAPSECFLVVLIRWYHDGRESITWRDLVNVFELMTWCHFKYQSLTSSRRQSSKSRRITRPKISFDSHVTNVYKLCYCHAHPGAASCSRLVYPTTLPEPSPAASWAHDLNTVTLYSLEHLSPIYVSCNVSKIRWHVTLRQGKFTHITRFQNNYIGFQLNIVYHSNCQTLTYNNIYWSTSLLAWTCCSQRVELCTNPYSNIVIDTSFSCQCRWHCIQFLYCTWFRTLCSSLAIAVWNSLPGNIRHLITLTISL